MTIEEAKALTPFQTRLILVLERIARALENGLEEN